MRLKANNMKTSEYSAQPKGHGYNLYQPNGATRVESVVFAILGLLGVVTVAVAVVWGSVPAGANDQSLAALGKLPAVRYVRSGQLTADARTLAAVVHYIFESEKPAVTNVVKPGPMQRNLAMPTNYASSAPKA